MTQYPGSARLGDLIAAAYDEAERYSSDPAEISRLATRAVAHMLEARTVLGAHSPHKAPLDQRMSPAGRRAMAALLKLVPPDGPTLRFTPSESAHPNDPRKGTHEDPSAP